MFLLSNLTEKAVLLYKARGGLALLTLAFSAVLYIVLAWLGVNGRFATTDFLLAASVAPAFLFCLMIALHYNDLVLLKKRAFRNRANIEIALRKRKNLVPLLGKITRKYMDHEKELQSSLVALRQQWSLINAKQNVRDDLRHVVRQVNGIVEAYPDLKAQPLAARLMQQLTHLENEIAVLREGNSDSVEEYNSRCKVFPDVILAKVFSFKLLKYI